jgi:hypothetical protein
MSARIKVVGLAFRVCVFFSMNPTAQLSEKQLAFKFKAANVRGSLRDAVRIGLLMKLPRLEGGGATHYQAGPRLLEMLEEFK